jgi:glycine/D-amino acid oxidase-like deaminating enzyme
MPRSPARRRLALRFGLRCNGIMTRAYAVEIAIAGAGIAGIATAYYLATRHGKTSVMLIDSRPPLGFTSAQSGDNYRNWWPHPTMVEFTDHSIDLMEEIARATGNGFNMTRRGYLLATREPDLDDRLDDLNRGYGDRAAARIRFRNRASSAGYAASLGGDWQAAPGGVDVISDARLIREFYPDLAPGIRHLLHIRRAGDIDSQRLGSLMLAAIREAGGRVVRGRLEGVAAGPGFILEVATPEGGLKLRAGTFVDAAGPFAGRVAGMLGVELPVRNVFQQKIAFEDERAAVPRDLPFVIDLDRTALAWPDDVRAMLAADPELGWLTETLPGGRHCRPDGGAASRRIKLGWAFNETASEPGEDLANEPGLHPQFPEIVLRGAAMLLPAMQAYVDAPPRSISHYGGYYTMTPENWPLVGPLGVDGAFTVAALSGFGSMAAAAAGFTCAAWICGADLPAYARELAPARYADPAAIAELQRLAGRSLL